MASIFKIFGTIGNLSTLIYYFLVLSGVVMMGVIAAALLGITNPVIWLIELIEWIVYWLWETATGIDLY